MPLTVKIFLKLTNRYIDLVVLLHHHLLALQCLTSPAYLTATQVTAWSSPILPHR